MNNNEHLNGKTILVVTVMVAILLAPLGHYLKSDIDESRIKNERHLYETALKSKQTAARAKIEKIKPSHKKVLRKVEMVKIAPNTSKQTDDWTDEGLFGDDSEVERWTIYTEDNSAVASGFHPGTPPSGTGPKVWHLGFGGMVSVPPSAASGVYQGWYMIQEEVGEGLYELRGFSCHFEVVCVAVTLTNS